MRILYHHRTLGDGAEGIHVASVVDAFRALGHDVRVAALIGERTNVSTPRTRLLQKVTRWTPRSAYELLELGYNVAGRQMLTREVRASRPDAIYERYMLFNVAGVSVARRFGIPLILEVNAPLAWERAQYERLSLRRTARRLERMVCSSADRVVVVSTPLKDYLVAEGVPAERISVVPNGADPNRFKPRPAAREELRRQLGLTSEHLVIGFSGILRPWHGVEMLIEAVAALPPDVRARARLVILGDGPSQRTLEQLAGERQLRDNIIFTGRLPHDRMADYLATFDVGVSPKATFYASPMKVPEYMAMGMAVIAPNTPNLVDLIDDGRTGMLFDAERTESLTQVLTSVGRSSELRSRLSAAARHEIVARRSWHHVAERALGLLQSLPSCA